MTALLPVGTEDKAHTSPMLLPPLAWRWQVGDPWVHLNWPLRKELGVNATISCDAWRDLIAAGSRPAFFQALDHAEQVAPATAVIALKFARGGHLPLHLRIVRRPQQRRSELSARLTLLPHTFSCWRPSR